MQAASIGCVATYEINSNDQVRAKSLVFSIFLVCTLENTIDPLCNWLHTLLAAVLCMYTSVSMYMYACVMHV